MITGTMRPADGPELQFAVEKDLNDVVRVILRVGGQRAARLDTEEQKEFLRYFRGAQAIANVITDGGVDAPEAL
jgi:hypothetical protein